MCPGADSTGARWHQHAIRLMRFVIIVGGARFRGRRFGFISIVAILLIGRRSFTWFAHNGGELRNANYRPTHLHIGFAESATGRPRDRYLPAEMSRAIIGGHEPTPVPTAADLTGRR